MLVPYVQQQTYALNLNEVKIDALLMNPATEPSIEVWVKATEGLD